MNGVALCARFSLATNRLRFCGPDDADQLLYETIVEGTRAGEARVALEKFEALLPYLEAIASHHGLDPFDPQVVEAYWIGNPLLDGFPREGFRAILDKFVKRGLPRSVATRLAGNLPADPIPHHAFHVAFVGVGMVSGKVPTTIENMEMCRVSWGRAVEVSGENVVAERPALVLAGDRLEIGPARRDRFTVDRKVIRDLAVGDTLAFHWGWPALVLSPTQRSSLEQYTYRALEAANSGLGSLGLL